MKIFVSYARRDRPAVELLLQDIRRARHDVWVDEELTGGQAWWDTILSTIRGADLVVLALSPDLLKSRACAAEYEYAVRCQRNILPVMVAPVSPQMAPPAIANAQIIDYVDRTPNAAINLVTAIAAAPPAAAVPDPLPAPPPVPMTYLNEFNEKVSEPSLSFEEQTLLLSRLRPYLNNEDDRDTAIMLVRRLRTRNDITESVGREIDMLLASLPPVADPVTPAFPGPTGRPDAGGTATIQPPPTSEAAAPTGAWKPDPFGRFELRYWNGSEWTDHVSTRGRQASDPPGQRATVTSASPLSTAPPPTAPPVAVHDPDGPFSSGAYVGLIIASVLIPLIGIVVGAINLKKPRRASQAKVLLAVGIGMVVLYMLAAL